MRNKDKLALGKSLTYGSVVCAILALLGALGTDLWLASTQWVLVSVLLCVWGIYVLVEAEFRIGPK